MPYCRFCHKEISKFDTDICPHCGEKNPIAQGYKTMDVTRNFKTLGAEVDAPKTKSQKVYAFLCMGLGYFGIHNFYIYRTQRGLIDIAITVLFIMAIGLPLFFTGVLANALAFIIPFLFVWLVNVGLGFYYLKVEAPKDGKGDFLR